MILKVRNSGDWWIWDNICKVRYTSKKFKEVDFKGYIDHHCPDIILAKDFSEVAGGNLDYIKSFIEICYRDKDDNEKLVLFDDVGYLCSDEGKTIERLSA
jgi:hypothetical protein